MKQDSWLIEVSTEIDRGTGDYVSEGSMQNVRTGKTWYFGHIQRSELTGEIERIIQVSNRDAG